MQLTFYALPGKRQAVTVGKAFCDGCKGHLEKSNSPAHARGPAAFYGVHRTQWDYWQYVVASGRTYFYADNGYLKPGHFGGHFRVTMNGRQVSPDGVRDPARYAALGVEQKRWRKAGAHILIATQTDWWYEQHGLNSLDWLMETKAALRRHTDRPIVVRPKPIWDMRHKVPPLSDQLQNCWAVVTFTSAVAIDAIYSGVPAIVLGPSTLTAFTDTDLSAIEKPRTNIDRDDLGALFAANQWTLDEMRAGKCWADLTARDAVKWTD